MANPLIRKSLVEEMPVGVRAYVLVRMDRVTATEFYSSLTEDQRKEHVTNLVNMEPVHAAFILSLMTPDDRLAAMRELDFATATFLMDSHPALFPETVKEPERYLSLNMVAANMHRCKGCGNPVAIDSTCCTNQ